MLKNKSLSAGAFFRAIGTLLAVTLFSLGLFACADKEKEQKIQKLETEKIELEGAIQRTKEAVRVLENAAQAKADSLNELDMAP